MKLKISLEHWLALIAVVDEGSYARAAVLLNKSQSTINYSVSKIEEQLNIKIFELVGRRSQLTESGRILYRQGHYLLHQAKLVEERASYLAQGLEAQLSLAVEIIFPPKMLLQCLEKFSSDPAAPPIELYESVLGGTEELLQRGDVDMAIVSEIPAGFIGDNLMHVEFIASAAPGHPLHQLKRDLSLDDLRKHRQLIVRDSGTRKTKRPTWVVSEPLWTVSHIVTSIRAAVMGLGFAWFPKECIRTELDSGELKPLPLTQGANFWSALYLVYANPDFIGPSARKLAEIIHTAVTDSNAFLKPVGKED